MRRGFTLIELLVVIAIISILAGILFPVFAKARAKGEQTQCLSNVRQLVMACSMYADDHDGEYPIGPSGHIVDNWNDPAAEPNWAKGIYTYIANLGLYQCPSAPEDENDPPDDPGEPVVSFVYNAEMAGMQDGISQQSVKVLLWDVGRTSDSAQSWGWNDGDGFPRIYPHWEPPHNEGRNYAFCDCHAKWLLDRYAQDQAQVLADGPYN